MKHDVSWNYDKYAGPELMHMEAIAYADCAIELFSRMESGALECTYLRGQAALYLAFHSTELFLKAAILQISNKLHKSHDLRELRKRYDELFPDKVFQIRTRFLRLYQGFTEAQEIDLKKKEKPTDQMLRYPIGMDTVKWFERETFDALTCLEQFSKYREDIKRAGSEIYKAKCKVR